MSSLLSVHVVNFHDCLRWDWLYGSIDGIIHAIIYSWHMNILAWFSFEWVLLQNFEKKCWPPSLVHSAVYMHDHRAMDVGGYTCVGSIHCKMGEIMLYSNKYIWRWWKVEDFDLSRGLCTMLYMILVCAHDQSFQWLTDYEMCALSVNIT